MTSCCLLMAVTNMDSAAEVENSCTCKAGEGPQLVGQTKIEGTTPDTTRLLSAFTPCTHNDLTALLRWEHWRCTSAAMLAEDGSACDSCWYTTSRFLMASASTTTASLATCSKHSRTVQCENRYLHVRKNCFHRHFCTAQQSSSIATLTRYQEHWVP
jgi:hypothetical protein